MIVKMLAKKRKSRVFDSFRENGLGCEPFRVPLECRLRAAAIRPGHSVIDVECLGSMD